MDYQGKERRSHQCDPQDYIGRLEHNEICKQVKAWVGEKVIGKGWLIGILLVIIGGLFGMTGYLIQYGGFAKDTDLKEVKVEVRVLGEKFVQHEKVSNSNAHMLKDINGNKVKK